MTRSALLSRLLKKYGEKVCVNGTEGYAVICPGGIGQGRASGQFFYLAGANPPISAGDRVETGGGAYLAVRSGVSPMGRGDTFQWARLEREGCGALCTE